MNCVVLYPIFKESKMRQRDIVEGGLYHQSKGVIDSFRYARRISDDKVSWYLIYSDGRLLCDIDEPILSYNCSLKTFAASVDRVANDEEVNKLRTAINILEKNVEQQLLDMVKMGADITRKEMEEEREEEWTIMNSCNLYAQIGVILCWYHDEDNMPFDLEQDEDEPLSVDELAVMQEKVDEDADAVQERIGRMVGMIPRIVRGEYEGIGSGILYDFWDALGMYPDRTDELEEIYLALGEVWHKTLQREKAKNSVE